MDNWIRDKLSQILQFDVPDDLISFILSIGSEEELKENMQTMLNFNDSEHIEFFLELASKKFKNQDSTSNDKKKKNNKGRQQVDMSGVSDKPTPPLKEDTPVSSGAGSSKKKTKFVNLYSQEGKNAQVVQLKGRHHCECQAMKHALVNNCLTCGRIVCKQEGSGPCLFCGSLVCTPAEQKEINSKTKDSAKLKDSLMERSRPKGWEAAVSHRNRLLEYDRDSSQRTHVTDDDSDYFNMNSVWLNPTEKDKLDKYQKALQEKKHASRLTKKMTFDFAGRQIVEDNTIEHEVDEDVIREITNQNARRDDVAQIDWFSGGGGDRDVANGVNADILQFDESIPSALGNAGATPDAAGGWRVQDARLQEMSDTGRCLSMHQPWASLLVEGIKMHEGRTWYTQHRGRLWIASTAKPPDPDVVKSLENRYRVLYPDKQLHFPSFYPAGCLLGCVSVDECLAQEEYRQIYPEGESDSPYVFICSNPVSLKLRFPVKGQHKLYTLDKTIHQAAVKCLQKMSKIQANAG